MLESPAFGSARAGECSSTNQQAGFVVSDPSRLISRKADSPRRGSGFDSRSSHYRSSRCCSSDPANSSPARKSARSSGRGDTFVEFDDALNTAVRKLRAALNDSADNPRFLETVPRRGYRFVAPVAWTPEMQAVVAPSKVDARHRPYLYLNPYLWLAVALIVARRSGY